MRNILLAILLLFISADVSSQSKSTLVKETVKAVTSTETIDEAELLRKRRVKPLQRKKPHLSLKEERLGVQENT